MLNQHLGFVGLYIVRHELNGKRIHTAKPGVRATNPQMEDGRYFIHQLKLSRLVTKIGSVCFKF
jgi:hypothetical protein